MLFRAGVDITPCPMIAAMSVIFSISMATPSSLALASIRLAVATQLRQPDPRTLICFMALPPLSDQGIEQIADADEGDGQIETEPRQDLQIGRASGRERVWKCV